MITGLITCPWCDTVAPYFVADNVPWAYVSSHADPKNKVRFLRPVRLCGGSMLPIPVPAIGV